MLLTQIQQTNKITALYMGQTDSHTGLWFPTKKITSEQIKEIFDRLPDDRISTPAKEFALKLINYNQQEILEELKLNLS